ncbi:MAG: hypothetical protein AB8H86_32960 [Polyangiales bacterium]
MDLKRIESWDRAKLEAEARRIGVWAPHRKESADLILRIRMHHTAPLRRAGRFLKRAANFALSLRPALPVPEAPKPAPKAKPTPAAEKPKASEPAKDPVQNKAPASGETARLAPKKVIADATLVEDDDGAMQEPIATRTMARLLAAQGHPRRALAIYKKLLREQPGDASLEEEAAALGSKRTRTSKTTPNVGASEEDDDSHATGEVVFVRGPEGQLIVAWSLPKAAAERAQSILGPQGRPTARVVVVRASSSGGILRETFDLQAGDATVFEGEGSIPAPPGSRVTAAIGLLAGERFVSVAHAEPRRV